MSGKEYDLKKCPHGRLKMATGEVLEVPIFRDSSCGKADSCLLKCEHNKKKT
jgi:hypothetical protein